MKKVFYLLLFVSSFCFSQSGFIEVEVRDTIKLNPSKIFYNITIDQSSLNRVEVGKTYDPIEAKKKTNSKLQEVKKFLGDENYVFHKIGESNFQIRNSLSSWNNGFTVIIKNVKDLEKLNQDLKQFNFIDALVVKVEHIDDNYSDERLLEKLIIKAKNKAKTIAQLSNLKIEKIIEVKEVKEIDNLSYSFLDLIVTSKGSNSFNGFNKIQSTRSKAIVVKFKTE